MEKLLKIFLAIFFSIVLILLLIYFYADSPVEYTEFDAGKFSIKVPEGSSTRKTELNRCK